MVLDASGILKAKLGPMSTEPDQEQLAGIQSFSLQEYKRRVQLSMERIKLMGGFVLKTGCIYDYSLKGSLKQLFGVIHVYDVNGKR